MVQVARSKEADRQFGRFRRIVFTTKLANQHQSLLEMTFSQPSSLPTKLAVEKVWQHVVHFLSGVSSRNQGLQILGCVQINVWCHKKIPKRQKPERKHLNIGKT